MPKSVAFAGWARSPSPSRAAAQRDVFFRFIALPPFPRSQPHRRSCRSTAAGNDPAGCCGREPPMGRAISRLRLLQEAFHNMLLCDMKTGIGDALAAAAGAAAGGVKVAGGALAEGEAAGEAAGGIDAQALGAPLEAPLDVP